MTRTDLQRLSNERIADAKALLAARRWSAAYYLAGYAVECALKACIAKHTKAEEFPDKSLADKCWTHMLVQLIGVAGLKDEFETARTNDRNLYASWEVVKDWTEASRYVRMPKAKAERLFAAITDKRHGVLTWAKQYW